MPSNNRSGIVHYFAGKYPDKIGLLYSPDGWNKPPYYMKYALDNGCFKKWEPEKFKTMLLKASLCHSPLWVAVPDVVADPEKTIKKWHEWHDKIYFPLAFVCQDGHEPQDVPKKAICCFIGGTTEWKLDNAYKFKGVRKLLHIGRVTTIGRLKWAEEIGADSVDGTGWFIAKNKQYIDFIKWFEGDQQIKLFD